MRKMIASVIMAACTCAARAQCSGPFSLTPGSGDTVTIECSQNGSKWDVTLNATADGGAAGITATLIVTIASTQLGTVTLTNTAGASVTFATTLQGSGGAVNIASVDSVVKGGGSNGKVTLANLRTSGDVGSIAVDAIEQARVGANLTGNVTVSDGNLVSLWVDGSIAGGVVISVPAGRIEVINVPTAGADIGASGNLATISCRDQLRRLVVADDVWANITVLNGSTYGPVDRLQIGGSSEAGTMHFDDFDPLDGTSDNEGLFVTGSLSGSVTIEGSVDEPIDINGDAAGAITIGGSVLATFDIDGTPTGPITIGGSLGQASPELIANFHLGTASVATPITADISFGGSIVRGDVRVHQPYDGEFTITGSVQTTGVAPSNQRFSFDSDFGDDAILDIGGDLSMPSQLQVLGQTEGRINIRGNSAGLVRFHDDFLAGASLHIGVSLIARSGDNGGIILFEETDDLIGQVVINSLDPGTAGEWFGEVRLHPNHLEPATITIVPGAPDPDDEAKHYQRLSSTIGGGAIGLVPFHMHEEDCDPPSGQTTAPYPSYVWISFYGPITWDDEEGFPFVVEYWSGTAWVDDTDNWFVQSGRGTRRIQIGAGDPATIIPDREYRVTPFITGPRLLFCDGLLTGTPVMVADFTYEFTTPPPP
jgi:hypothetical protein